MSSATEKKNNAPLIIALVLVVLIGLGIAVYFAFFAKEPPKAPIAQPVAVQPAPPPQPIVPTPPPAPQQKILGVHDVVPKDTLWWISNKWYKDPILWPSIYEINQAQIKNPDLIYPGQKFDIPALIGTKEKLSQDDYTLLAKGYLEAYRVYQSQGKKNAAAYKKVGEKYQVKANR